MDGHIVVTNKKTHTRSVIDNAETTLASPSVVEVPVPKEKIANMSRSGDALLIRTTDGDVITIQGFFSPPGAPGSDLVLQEGPQLWHAQLAEDGLSASAGQYVPIDSIEPLLIPQSSDLNPLLLALGAIGIAGGAAAIAGGGGDGGGSNPPATPQAPSVAIATDANQDGIVSVAELNGSRTVTVRVGLPTAGPAPAAGDTVRVSDGTTSYVHTLTAADVSQGSVSIDIPAPPNGQTLTVSATLESASGVSQPSANASAIMEIAAPSATLVINNVTPDNVINGTEATGSVMVSGIVTGQFIAGDLVSFTLNGTSYSAPVLANGSWSVEVAGPDLATDAGRTIAVSLAMHDSAGNAGTASATHLYGVDTTPPIPAETISVNAVTDDRGTSNTDFVTNDNTLVLSGALGTALAAGDHAQISLDGGMTWLTFTVSGATWSFDNTGKALPDGTYTVQARVVDTAGNVGATDSQILVIDTVPPSPATTIDITAIDDDSGASASDFNTNDNTPIFSGTLGAILATGEAAQISLDNGATWQGVTVNGTAWSFDNSGIALANGLHAVLARVVDAAGNVGAADSQIVVIDTVPPSPTETVDITAITSDFGISTSDFVTSDNTLVVSGTLGAALAMGEGVQISLDGGVTWLAAIVNGTAWNFDNAGTALADGAYTVQARVIDAAGNIGATDSQDVIVDTTPPSFSESVDIAAIATDSGTSTTDFNTSDSTLTFSGTLGATLTDGEGAQISLDGGATWKLATVSGTTWSFDNTGTALADGTYAVQVRVIDIAGNVGAIDIQNVVIDTTPPSPTATIDIAAITTDTGATATDFNTSDNTLTFSGTLGTALAPGEGVQISLDGGTTWLTATVTGTAWSLDNTGTAQADGTYTVQARVIDTAGNVGATDSQDVVIDTAPPTATIDIAAITTDSGSSATDFNTSDNTLVFNGTLGAALAAGENAQISLDGGATWLTTTVTGTDWSLDSTATVLADGTYTVQARVIDTAGNVGATGSQDVIIDTTPPTAAIDITAITTDTGATATDFNTSDNTLTFSGTLGAALAAGESVQISLDNGATWQMATVTGTAWSFDNASTALLDGTYAVQARVIDIAGNVGATDSQDVVIDTIPPSPSETIGITAITIDTGTSTSDFNTSDNTLTFSGTLGATLAAGESVQISLDGGVTWQVASVNGTDWSFDNTGNNLADGTYIVQARVVDIAGNVGQSDNQDVVIDTVAPSTPVVNDITAITVDTGSSASDFITNDNTLVFGGVLSTALADGDSIQISLDNGATWLTATASGTPWSFDNTAVAMADGTYTVQARVVDTAGNVGATDSQVVVIDTTPPSPTATIDITAIANDSGASTTDFNTSDNTLAFSGTLGAALAAGEGVQVSLDGGTTWQSAIVNGTTWSFDDTGTVLPDGTYTVQARVIDIAGNVGATDSQTVIVDTTPPSPTETIAITAIADDTGASTADFNTSDSTLLFSGTLGTDLAAGESVQISLDGGTTWQTATVAGTAWSFDNTGNALPDGTYSVQARVIDVAGNIGQIDSQDVVIDTLPPSPGTTIDITAITTDSGTSAADFNTNDGTLSFSGTLGAALAAGESVQISLDNGATWQLATVNGTAWSFDNSGTLLADGTYAVQVRVIDIAGNVGATDSQDVIVDTAPPSPTETIDITAIATDTGSNATDFSTSDNTLVFNGTLGTALAAGETAQISLDNGTTWQMATVTGTTWSFDNTGSALADGTYTIQARIVDTAGNVGATDSQDVIIDTGAPPPTETIDITAITTDTGTNTADFITNDNTLVFSGTLGSDLSPGNTVEISLDGGTTWQAATVNGTAWSFDNTGNALPDGTYAVQAHVIDAVGNVGASDSQDVIVDTVPPSPTETIDIVAIADDTGASASDFNTSDNALTFTGTLGVALAAGDSVQVSLDGGTTWLTTDVAGTTWSLDNTGTALADGDYVIQARVIDTAGNTGATDSQAVVIDTVPPSPTETIAITAMSVDSGTSTTDFVSSDNTLTFSGILGTALADGESVQISLDGGTTWQTATVSGTDWSFDNTGNALPDGTYSVQARVIDVAGNVGQLDSQDVVIDTVPPSPTATIAITAIAGDTGTSPSDFETNDGTLVFSGTLGAALAADENAQVSFDNGVTWLTATVSGTTWSLDHTGTALADGTYNMQARVIDTAGNVGATNSQDVVIDTVPPSPTETIDITSITDDSGTNTADFITNDNTLVFSGTLGTALAAGEGVQISLDNGAIWQTATVAGTTWTFDNTANALADDSYTAQVRIVDAAGNIGQSDSQTVVIDTVAPSPTETVAITAVTDDTGNSATDFNTSDNALTFSGTLGIALAAGESVQISLDGGVTWQAAIVNGTDWNFDNTATVLADGTYNVQARVVDTAGNVGATDSQDVVIDTIPPSSTATIDITAITTDTGASTTDFNTSDNTLTFSGTLGAALAAGENAQISLDGGATWLTTTVTGTDWSLDSTATVLADGTYTVQARVIDTAGNVGATDSQDVVIDTTPPSPTATIDITAITTDTGASATDFNTSDNTLVISGTLGAALATGESAQISLNGGTTWLTASITDTSWMVDNTATVLVDGTYTIQARVVDTAGNMGQTDSQALIVDTVALAFSAFIIDVTAPSDNGLSATDNTTSVVTPTLTGSITGLSAADIALASQGVITATLFDDLNNDGVLDPGDQIYGQGIPLTVTGSDADFSVTMPSMYNGSYRIKAILTDAAGNTSSVGPLDGNPAAVLVIDTAGTPSIASSTQANDGLGLAMASAGDFNGDGYTDFIVSAPHNQLSNGVANFQSDMYIVYGRAEGLPSLTSIDSMTAAGGIRITATTATGIGGDVGVQGQTITSIGDINGDGFDDVVMASNINDRAYIVFGRGGNSTATISLASIENGATADGFVIKNSNTGGWFGNSAAGGDINGDGYSDFIIGSQDSGGNGQYFVVYGHAGAPGSASWSDLLARTDGFYTATGGTASTLGTLLSNQSSVNTTFTRDGDSDLGTVAAVIDDVNGDGYADYLVSAPRADSVTNGDAGEVYLIFGSSGGLGSAFNLNALTPSQGIRMTGTQNSEWLGGTSLNGGGAGDHGDAYFAHTSSLKNIGDINGDGIADFAIGSPGWGDNAGDDQAPGRVYVVYGKAAGDTWTDLNLDTLDGTNGFILSSSSNTTTVNAQLGFAISAGGDVNGDGIDDFLIGAPNADGSGGTNSGAAYLVFGRPGGGFTATTDLDVLVASGEAIRYDGTSTNEYAGTGVATGDWNGDGIADYAYGSWENDRSSANGGTYYVYTGSIARLTQAYTTGDDVLSVGGTSPDAPAIVNGVDILSGGQGNDAIQGIGTDTTGTISTTVQHDVALGGQGNDVINLAGMNFTRVDGGLGVDTLQFGGTGLSLDLSTFGERVKGFETFDLGTNGANTLQLRLTDVLNEPDSLGSTVQFTIKGDGTSTVDLVEPIDSGNWQTTGQVSLAGVTYDIWHDAAMGANTAADVLIQNGLNVV